MEFYISGTILVFLVDVHLENIMRPNGCICESAFLCLLKHDEKATVKAV